MVQLSYRLKTLAKATDISVTRLKMAIYRGDLVAVKPDADWLVLHEDAMAYLKSLAKKPKKARETSEASQAQA